MRKLALLLLVALPLFAAEPTYVIRYRLFPEPGKSTHVRSHFSMTDAITFVDPSGKEVNKPLSEDKDEDYIESTLAEEGGEATEFTRTYATPADKSYSGRPVHFVRSGGTVQATANGAELKELQELAKSVKGGSKETRALLPKQPVAVGQTWPVDTVAATESLASTVFGTIDAQRSKGIGKLVSVTQKNGHPIATVDITLDLMPIADKSSPFSSISGFHATIRMEGAIDGNPLLHSTFGATLKAEQPVTTNGRQVVVKHDFKFAENAQQEDAR